MIGIGIPNIFKKSGFYKPLFTACKKKMQFVNSFPKNTTKTSFPLVNLFGWIRLNFFKFTPHLYEV